MKNTAMAPFFLEGFLCLPPFSQRVPYYYPFLASAALKS